MFSFIANSVHRILALYSHVSISVTKRDILQCHLFLPDNEDNGNEDSDNEDNDNEDNDNEDNDNEDNDNEDNINEDNNNKDNDNEDNENNGYSLNFCLV